MKPNRQLVLANRPNGLDPVNADTWTIRDADIPELKDGQFLGS